LGLGFDTFFPATSHSPRKAGRRFIKPASTFLKRGTLPIPLRTNRICRYAYCLWSFFQKKLGGADGYCTFGTMSLLCPNPAEVRLNREAEAARRHVRFSHKAGNRACLCDRFTNARHGRQAAKARLFRARANSSTPLLENIRTLLPPGRLIHHCMPFALWYGRKRANIGYGQRGL
jgi:hypothetical protein